ncbi:hypothetical protein LTR62_002534 [Meristemomyces frigidus]|uniref:Carboxylic ester hydrolase n=1 Tax=Meristemomyces frigidus TaxID=1508187 RepID=A0AAN7TGP3_9PEZI|nr:hypothetical protein LTR62_002534 [Meristemomyces frigidus]
MFLYCSLLLAGLVAAIPSPYAGHTGKLSRRDGNLTLSPLEVDLGYMVIEGFQNQSAQLNLFRGIRYGQDTSGQNRWQPPRVPETNRTSVFNASSYGSQCPQAPDASSTYTVTDNSKSSEDCLFLNVFAPSTIPQGNSTSEPSLPVLVWIHGGGYAQGAGAYDLIPLTYTNNNQFVAVEMNYRLGAFGFLSSDELARKGTPNAGILDQQLALQWIQQYIHLFGGDSRRVTIFGESAGAGSVMLHELVNSENCSVSNADCDCSIANGGTLGSSLFRNSISASPYLAFQYGYKDWQPSQSYYALAGAAGCDVKDAYLHNGSRPIIDCLRDVDSVTLMNAAVNVSQSGTWGTWPFLPVTDGVLIQSTPSQALLEGKINGVNHLAGHNALEGASWVPPKSIDTIDDLVDYLTTTFPNFDNNDIAKILLYYPSSNASTDFSAPLWSTEGSYGPTTINQSIAATGQQQRAIAIYGETTFICPSYWLAEAYSNNKHGGQGWKYQFSIPNAYHGADGSGYVRWPYTGGYYSPDYIIAFMRMLGAFVVNDDPSVSSLLDNGINTGNSTFNPVSDWPPYSIYNPVMMDFNTTCPELVHIGGLPYCSGGGQLNEFRLADAYTWEGGRGVRCDFWRMMGAKVPE